MNRQFSLSLVLVLASLAKVQSFAPAARLCSTPVAADRVFGVVQPSTTRVWMAEEEAEKAEDPKAEEVEAKDESGEAEEESKEEEEDPEIKAIKDEIAELESTLKSQRTTLDYTKDSADEYTKSGYSRKVAEMENMRRIRSNLNLSSRSSSSANVLMEFVSVYDRLNELKEKYGDDEFGTKYSGLTLKPAFSKMGVEEYTVEAGATVDNVRMNVVESEYSSEYAKDTVIRPVTMGMELEGNVMRPADCVASSGAEEGIKAAEEGDDVDETDAAKEE